MNQIIRITIDGKECYATKGQYLVDAAKENGIYIPTLCNYPGVKPKGSCRICTVKVNGKLQTACTTPVSDGMVVENSTQEIEELRKAIIELFFVEGNHFCPSCEKSGECELQALAYRYKIMVPRYPYLFPVKAVDASNPKLIQERNRCVLCKRCIRIIKDEQGRSLFAYRRRSNKVEVVLDDKLGKKMTDDLAKKAMEICPVGSLILKGRGFIIPIGKRKYDKEPIGSDIEKIIPTNNKK